MSTTRRGKQKTGAGRKRQSAKKDNLLQNVSEKQGNISKVIIKSTKNNQSRIFVISEKPEETPEIILPEKTKRKKYKNFGKGQPIEIPSIDEETLKGNPSLERGLKILAAAVPEAQQHFQISATNSKHILSSLKYRSGLTVKPAVNQIEHPQIPNTTYLPSLNGISNSYPGAPLLQVNAFPTIPTPMTIVPNYINANGSLILPSGSGLPIPEQNHNIIYTSAPENVIYSPLPAGSTTSSSVIVKPANVDNLPKISAIHSLYNAAETTSDSKVNKCEQICHYIEENSSLYLGIGKRELCVLKLLSNVCQLTRKQLFIIIRKMRHNESIEILADHFEIQPEEITQTIMDNVPKIGHLIRKTLKLASEVDSKDYIIDQMSLSIHRASYLSEQPEEVSRYSTKFDLKYIISCTHSGLINFLSKGYEFRSKYSSIEHLYSFVYSIKPKSVYIAGIEMRDIERTYLRHKGVIVKNSKDICYRMNFVRALDGIKQFKIFCNTDVPLRHDFFNIIDDLMMLACWLYNCKIM